MKRITEVEERNPIIIKQLTKLWEKSVKATHEFLSDHEIEEIKKSVPQALNDVADLIIAENDSKTPVAFMGVENNKLEMLFVSPEERGNGLGKKLIQYGIEKFSINELCVNEQNPKATGFYEHLGFQVYKRTDQDEQGRPYPLLYMRLAA